MPPPPPPGAAGLSKHQDHYYAKWDQQSANQQPAGQAASAYAQPGFAPDGPGPLAAAFAANGHSRSVPRANLPGQQQHTAADASFAPLSAKLVQPPPGPEPARPPAFSPLQANLMARYANLRLGDGRRHDAEQSNLHAAGKPLMLLGVHPEVGVGAVASHLPPPWPVDRHACWRMMHATAATRWFSKAHAMHACMHAAVLWTTQ